MLTETLFQLAARRFPEQQLGESLWRELLAFADRTQLSLHLRGIPYAPGWFAEALEQRHRDNAARRERLREALSDAAGALTRAGIEFVVLKGFTHEHDFGIDGAARVQYDLDLWVQSAEVGSARRALAAIGFAPNGKRSLSDEHERAQVRPFTWKWRGNYFDPDMPVAIELHGHLWNPKRDRIVCPGLEAFWARRCRVELDGIAAGALHARDRLAFAALHALRHILRHDARPAHVFELGRMLEHCARQPDFWEPGLHSPALCRLQAVALLFAQHWFGCSLPPALANEAACLPPCVLNWFRDFAWSPAKNLLTPNKDVVWLHASLLDSWRECARVIAHLLPLRVPHTQEAGSYGARLLARASYHLRALAPAFASGVRLALGQASASTASHSSSWNRRSV
jgi:hypothetical protein